MRRRAVRLAVVAARLLLLLGHGALLQDRQKPVKTGNAEFSRDCTKVEGKETTGVKNPKGIQVISIKFRTWLDQGASYNEVKVTAR